MNDELRIISYICSKFNDFMKKFLHYLGIYLIILGVFTLALTRLPALMVNNTYRLTWVSLTLGVGYLFTAAPAKRSHCSLP